MNSEIEDDYVLKAIAWRQTNWQSVSTEAIKQFFGFDVGDMSIINEEIDAEFQELFLSNF